MFTDIKRNIYFICQHMLGNECTEYIYTILLISIILTCHIITNTQKMTSAYNTPLRFYLACTIAAILFNEHRRGSLGAISAWVNGGCGNSVLHKRNIKYVTRICRIILCTFTQKVSSIIQNDLRQNENCVMYVNRCGCTEM